MEPDPRFLALVQQLTHWCPTVKPVRVYRVKQLDVLGEFLDYSDHFRILIMIGSFVQEHETLVHEWAHALTYHPNRPKRMINLSWGNVADGGPLPWVLHGDEWGVAFAQCYRAATVPVGMKYGPHHPEMDWMV